MVRLSVIHVRSLILIRACTYDQQSQRICLSGCSAVRSWLNEDSSSSGGDTDALVMDMAVHWRIGGGLLLLYKHSLSPSRAVGIKDRELVLLLLRYNQAERVCSLVGGNYRFVQLSDLMSFPLQWAITIAIIRMLHEKQLLRPGHVLHAKRFVDRLRGFEGSRGNWIFIRYSV